MPGVGRQTAGAAGTQCLRAALDARSTGRDPRRRRRAGLAGRQHLETTPWEVVGRYILIHVLDGTAVDRPGLTASGLLVDDLARHMKAVAAGATEVVEPRDS